MDTEKKKDKKNVVDNKTTKNKGVKQKKKEGRVEGLDQGFITKWVI